MMRTSAFADLVLASLSAWAFSIFCFMVWALAIDEIIIAAIYTAKYFAFIASTFSYKDRPVIPGKFNGGKKLRKF